jgi:hypothetical protein
MDRRRITVEKIITSRYEVNKRPASWDQRVAGRDLILATNGEPIPLDSTGGQSPPQPGWVILLTDGSQDTGYHWTLYGLPRGVTVDHL